MSQRVPPCRWDHCKKCSYRVLPAVHEDPNCRHDPNRAHDLPIHYIDRCHDCERREALGLGTSNQPREERNTRSLQIRPIQDIRRSASPATSTLGPRSRTPPRARSPRPTQTTSLPYPPQAAAGAPLYQQNLYAPNLTHLDIHYGPVHAHRQLPPPNILPPQQQPQPGPRLAPLRQYQPPIAPPQPVMAPPQLPMVPPQPQPQPPPQPSEPVTLSAGRPTPSRANWHYEYDAIDDARILWMYDHIDKSSKASTRPPMWRTITETLGYPNQASVENRWTSSTKKKQDQLRLSRHYRGPPDCNPNILDPRYRKDFGGDDGGGGFGGGLAGGNPVQAR